MPEKPLVVAAIIGNSHLLATLDGRGEMHQLFWPNIDFGQHVGVTLAGLYVPGRSHRTSWLSREGCSRHQTYLPDTNIVRTTTTQHELGLEVEQHDFALPNRSLVARKFHVRNSRAVPVPVVFCYYAALDLDGAQLLNTVYYAPDHDALVYYRRGVYVALGSEHHSQAHQCGRENTPGSALWAVEENRLSGHAIEMGDIDAALSFSLGTLEAGASADVAVYIAAGVTAAEALDQLDHARREGAERLLAHTIDYWKNWLARGRRIDSGDERVDALYRRSLLAMKLLADAGNGGIIAAPETDPGMTNSGGYGYCWGRDAAWITTAFDEAGYHQEAEAFYRWAVRVQEPDGGWYQRYFTNGSLAPSWGLVQIDETGSIIYGMWHHYGLTRDAAFLREMWPTVRMAAAFLVRNLDPQTQLPRPTVDIWEERTEESAYSSAAVYGGLLAAAQIATEIGDFERAARWRDSAAQIKAAVVKHLWHEPDDRFSRAVKRQIGHGEYMHRKAHGDAVSQALEGNNEVYYEDRDRGLDASLLGIAMPFGVLPAIDHRMRATGRQIAQYLVNSRVGGIHRYTGDGYRGGNPWVICTLWLGLYQLAIGERDSARAQFQWAVEHRTELGLLPEQVDRESGRPAWVVPLNWSHALLVHSAVAFDKYGVFAEARRSPSLRWSRIT